MFTKIRGFLRTIRLFYWIVKIRLAIAKHKANKAKAQLAVPASGEAQDSEQALTKQPPLAHTVLELFSGIGGTRIGAEQVGFKIIGSSEIDQHCVSTYRDNFGESSFGDITKIEIDKLPNFTVLTASTPCQSFSTQGKRKGLKDTRGQLIHHVFRIIEAKKPRVVFIENVKGMASINDGQALNFVLKKLRQLGYTAHHQVLKASHYGVPQKRERLFIVAFQENVPFRFPKPTVLPAPSSSVLEKSVHENFFLNQAQVDRLVSAKERYDSKGHNFGFQILEPNKPANTLLRSESSLQKNLVAGRSGVEVSNFRRTIGDIYQRWFTGFRCAIARA